MGHSLRSRLEQKVKPVGQECPTHMSTLSGFYFNPDRRPYKSEFLANLVFQESLIRKVQLHLTVGEEHDRWRGDGGLGEVENPHALFHGDGRAVEIDMFQEAVHLARGDALAAFGGDFLE